MNQVGNQGRKQSNYFTKNKFDMMDANFNMNNKFIPGTTRNKAYSISNVVGFNNGQFGKRPSNKTETKEQLPLNKDYDIGEADKRKFPKYLIF